MASRHCEDLQHGVVARGQLDGFIGGAGGGVPEISSEEDMPDPVGAKRLALDVDEPSRIDGDHGRTLMRLA
jgi:hypothetical protein